MKPIFNEDTLSESPAIAQLQRYQEGTPQLFHANQILIGLNLFGAKYGTILSSAEFFHEWKAPGNEKFPNMAEHPSVKEMLELGLIKKDDLQEHPTKQGLLVAGILNKRNLLDTSAQEKQREVYARSLGLRDVKELSFYGVLSPFRDSLFSASEKEQAAFTREVIESVKAKSVIDWTEKNDVQREMRREIKGLLRERGFQEEQIEPLVAELMNLARIHLKET